MILPVFLLFAQAAMQPAPLGYVESVNGRLYPLYGMRFNFVLGEAADPGVLAAWRLGNFDLRQMESALRIGGLTIALSGTATLLAADTDSLLAWAPDSRELIRIAPPGWRKQHTPSFPNGAFSMAFQRGRVAVLSRGERGIEISDFDAASFEPISRRNVEAQQAALDSTGKLWTSTGLRLRCEDNEWEFREPVSRLKALDEGWLLIRSGGSYWAARCDSAELSAVPEPAP